MTAFKSITGLLQAEITSAELEAVLEAVSRAGVEVFRFQYLDPLTCRFWMRRKDCDKTQKLCSAKGAAFRICGKSGYYWSAKELLQRPVILAGLLFFLTMTLVLPTRILFVEVEGNQSISAGQIIEAAEACGIRFGASRREVRSEKTKNALLKAIPQLQWAGVNTYGCVAVVSVRERAPEMDISEEHIVSHIVARRDGYILSGTVTQGTGNFRIGDAVKEGEILISGYTDCGLSIRAERASGEVFAQTNRLLEAVSPGSCLVRTEKRETKRKISLLIRKKRINLWKDSGISDSTCVRIYEEYYVTLPGGFVLPAALCIEEYTSFSTQRADTPAQEAELLSFADRYILDQTTAGQITDRAYTITAENDVCRFSGAYVCVEMIGREQIGDTNGETG